MSPRLRADRLLVERGLFDSRAKAQAAIAAGRVSADGALVRKPSEEIDRDAKLSAAPAHPFVSRGGVKLAAALDALSRASIGRDQTTAPWKGKVGARAPGGGHPCPLPNPPPQAGEGEEEWLFSRVNAALHVTGDVGLDVTGRVCLDVGASTGGFTQVLLERGARLVYAVDVGRGQLHPQLAADPRVVSIEGTDIRALDPDLLAEPPSLVVIDVSFISLKLVLPAALALAAPACHLVALVKPQFEAGRAHLKKGIVRDPQVHAAVCEDIAAFVRSLGCTVGALLLSPIEGGDGNREFLLIAWRGAP